MLFWFVKVEGEERGKDKEGREKRKERPPPQKVRLFLEFVL